MTSFAIVGAGVIGAHHAAILSRLASLTAIVDVDTARAEQLASAHGARPYPTLAAALGAAPIDAVVVCTPTGRHGPVAIEALRAGKHVVLEKPAEITVERTDEIIRAQRDAGTLVTVISQHRFDPATERVLEAIGRGEFGRVTSGIASVDWWRAQSYYDSGDWRGTWALDGGGALMNQGVHTVDLLIAALGRPVEVFAWTGTLAHERIEVEDVAAGLVRFDSGALGVLHATTSAYPGLSARLQVHGDRGSAVIDNDELTYFGDAAVTATGANTASQDPGRLSGAHHRQYLNFLGALAGTEPLRVDLATNRLAISVITGAYRSARTGRPVSLAGSAA
ncbi:putative dehydrogenase [Actinoplanes tereljensis]|uniref:Oxidoreductase n=1 Tax=Paractinoplanes tereljensis TaxID=571912 RepID=A0A919NQ27_9ACTN|nr:Gfo/Idh/MocA family oxidoreductase [Actinoplanes tereljensis]GIF21782.1 oxidoreductase [Actinoplanes tereljensis]